MRQLRIKENSYDYRVSQIRRSFGKQTFTFKQHMMSTKTEQS